MINHSALLCGLVLLSLSIPATAQTTSPSTRSAEPIEQMLDRAHALYREGDLLLGNGTFAEGELKLRQALEISRNAYREQPELLRARLAMLACLDKVAYARYAADPRGNIDEVLRIAGECETMLLTIPEDTDSKYVLMRLAHYRYVKATILAPEMENGQAPQSPAAMALVKEAAVFIEHSALLDALAIPSPNQQERGVPGDLPAHQRLPYIYLELAKIYNSLRHHDLAIQTTRCLQALVPEDVQVYQMLASIHRAQDDHDRAAQALVCGVLIPDAPQDVWDQLDTAYTRLNTSQTPCILGEGQARRLNIEHPMVQRHVRDGYSDIIRAWIASGNRLQARTIAQIAVDKWNVPQRAVDAALTDPQRERLPPLPIYFKP